MPYRTYSPLGPLTAMSNDPGIPTAVFHGVGGACVYDRYVDMMNVIRNGTGAYTECIEVGLPAVGSILHSMEELSHVSC